MQAGVEGVRWVENCVRSASQGAFYILPARGSSSDDEYGGTYDKSTIDKLARVVVTVEYALTQ